MTSDSAPPQPSTSITDSSDASGISVPGTAEEVTGAWLATCLGLDDQAPPQMTITRIGADYGLASTLLRVRLTGAGTPYSSVVLKLWSSDQPSGLREARLMAAFGSRLGTRVPACLHSGIDETAGRAAMVLEDLGDVIQGDCLDLITTDIGVGLARSFAAVHATWWRSRELAGADWLPSTPWLTISPNWLQSRRVEYLERFGQHLAPPFRRFLDRLTDSYDRAAERLSAVAPTLLHEDVHLDNVVFDRPTGAPILLDWARAATGPGVLDLVALLSDAEPDAVDPMLAAYRESLGEHGVPDGEIGGPGGFDDTIAAATVVCLVRKTCGIARWRPDSERATRMLDGHVDRVHAMFDIWRRRVPRYFADGGR